MLSKWVYDMFVGAPIPESLPYKYKVFAVVNKLLAYFNLPKIDMTIEIDMTKIEYPISPPDTTDNVKNKNNGDGAGFEYYDVSKTESELNFFGDRLNDIMYLAPHDIFLIFFARYERKFKYPTELLIDKVVRDGVIPEDKRIPYWLYTSPYLRIGVRDKVNAWYNGLDPMDIPKWVFLSRVIDCSNRNMPLPDFVHTQ